MNRSAVNRCSIATMGALALLIGAGCAGQSAPNVAAGAMGEESVAVAGGGVHVPGWTGRIDAQEVAAGLALSDARFASEGNGFRVATGPAVTYWNPANRASGNYTVRATFTEPRYMSINDHPHPYGIVIAGNDLGTDQQSYLYCSAYGNGTFIVRGFGPEPFRASASRPEEHAAVARAADRYQPVTQEIAMSVRGDAVECSINGTVVARYPRSELVAQGRLKSTDGVYGVRFGHNTEVLVSGLSMTTP